MQSLSPPSWRKWAAHGVKSCASKNTQGHQKGNALLPARAQNTTSRMLPEGEWTSRQQTLFKSHNGEGPPGPDIFNGQLRATIVARKIETIHSNHGPSRRGRTKQTPERKEERNERRKQKRRNRRGTAKMLTIATWIWMGQGGKTTAIIHSQRCGIILRGAALDEWKRGNQRMDFKERATQIQIGKISQIAVYQPISTHGQEAIEDYRADVEDLVAKSPRDTIPVIGGDHNSQISRIATHQERYGLDTPTNEQGMDIIQWCSEQKLECVNGFSVHNNRGTWFHRKPRRSFEIDGFLMRADQRHKHMRRMQTITEMSYSDHKPLILRISTKMKKLTQGRRTTSNIKLEVLRHKEKAEEFRQRTTAITWMMTLGQREVGMRCPVSLSGQRRKSAVNKVNEWRIRG